MSVLGLLAMGRAFGTVRQRPPSYQVAEGWLPDFGCRQEREMGDLDGHETVLPRSGWPERNVGGRLTSSLFEVRSGHLEELAEAGSGVACRPAEKPEVASRHRGGPVGALVQGERSLKSVRVVRNDLSADDLALVPRPSTRVVVSLATRSGGPHAGGGGWRGWLAHWWCFFRRRAC